MLMTICFWLQGLIALGRRGHGFAGIRTGSETGINDHERPPSFFWNLLNFSARHCFLPEAKEKVRLVVMLVWVMELIAFGWWGQRVVLADACSEFGFGSHEHSPFFFGTASTLAQTIGMALTFLGKTEKKQSGGML